MVRTDSSKMLEEYPALSAVPGPQEALQASVPNVKAGRRQVSGQAESTGSL